VCAREWGEAVRAVQQPRIQRLQKRCEGTVEARRLLDDLVALAERVNLGPPTSAWLAADCDDDWFVLRALTAGAILVDT
jgi:hypothetical protein